MAYTLAPFSRSESSWCIKRYSYKSISFESLKIQDEIKHNFIDICSHEELKKIFQDENPDFVFHLAAQAIVSSSYDSPIETVQTNAVGTLQF